MHTKSASPNLSQTPSLTPQTHPASWKTSTERQIPENQKFTRSTTIILATNNPYTPHPSSQHSPSSTTYSDTSEMSFRLLQREIGNPSVRPLCSSSTVERKSYLVGGLGRVSRRTTICYFVRERGLCLISGDLYRKSSYNDSLVLSYIKEYSEVSFCSQIVLIIHVNNGNIPRSRNARYLPRSKSSAKDRRVKISTCHTGDQSWKIRLTSPRNRHAAAASWLL